MKHKTLMKQVVSVLLAFVLALGLVLPSLAVDSASVTKSGKGLTFEQVDNDDYDVKLPNKNEVKAEEQDDVPQYEDTEIVRVSIVLEDPSTLEQGFTADDIATQSRKAVKYRQTLQTAQEKMEGKISTQALDGEALDVVWNLTLAANIISANVEYGQIEEIEKVKGVKEVLIETCYEPCVVNREEAADPNMSTSDEMIGSISAWASGYTGAGRKIAIIDTGADVDHPSLDPDAFSYAVKDSGATLMTAADTEKVLSRLNVSKRMEGITAAQLYVDAKIPFGFNYVDSTLNIGHDKDDQGDHGSHVSGIAAGNRYVKNGDGTYADALDTVLTQGVAPDAQLLVMKVFGLSGGANDSDYMAAIEDAMVLGADSANLSLGSASVGNSRVEEVYRGILENVVNSGLVVVMSAGNSGNWFENTFPGAAYADSSSWITAGSPGTYTNSLDVASVDNIGVTGAYIEVAGNKMCYNEKTDAPIQPMTTLAGEQRFVYIDSIGTAEEFAAVADEVKGAIALCNRGSLNFVVKGNNAIAAGAIGVIIVNNEPGTINISADGYNSTAPYVSLLEADGMTIKANSEKKEAEGFTYYVGSMTVSQDVSAVKYSPDYYTMSDFSSWGIPGSLEMKPEIAAPGGSIYSLKNGGGYQNMSGTSMAAPQVSGMVAVLAQYIEEKGYTEKTGLTLRALAQSLLMSTAEPMYESEGRYYPVLRQGSGLANIGAAVSAGSYLMMDSNATDSYKDGKIKVELGDDPARTGAFSFGYTINNLEDTATAFNLFADFFTQDLMSDEDGTLYESTRTAPIPSNVTFTVDGKPVEAEASEGMEHCDFNGDGKVTSADGQALLDYVTGVRTEINDKEYADFDEDGGIDTYDAYLFFKRIGTVAVEVPANGSIHVTVNVTLDKSTLDAYDEASDGTGTYIEGYVYASELTSAEGVLGTVHSIPVVGYYGGWTDSSMFDVGSYIDYFVSNEEDRASYMYNRTSASLRYQSLLLQDKGENDTYNFGGNPYISENFYDPERDSVNTNATLINGIGFTAIRNFSASRAVIRDEEGNIYVDNQYGDGYGAYYHANSSNPKWYNYSLKVPLGMDLSDVAEGEKLNISLTLAPEYYVDAEGNTNWDALGEGATQSYSAYVDKTAPTISDISLTESLTSDKKALAVTASDNRYIATVALFNYDTGAYATSGSSPAGVEAGHTDIFEVEMDEAMQAATHLLIQVYDYAGNYTTYKINRNEEELNNPVSVELSDETLNLIKGASYRLTAEVSPFGVQPDTVTWTSDDAEVATVSEDGLVTAVGIGSAVITATSVKDPAASASCEVTVETIHSTIYGALQDEEGNGKFFSWNFADAATWTAGADLENKTVSGATYNKYDGTVMILDENYNLHEVDPATGKDLGDWTGVMNGGEQLPLFDIAHSALFSDEGKPVLAWTYGSYISTLQTPDALAVSAYPFSEDLAKTGANYFTAIASLGAMYVNMGGGVKAPGDIYVLLDNAGYIWTVGYIYYNNKISLYTLGSPEQTTLPKLSYPAISKYSTSMASLVCEDNENATVLYLSYFNGSTNEIYRLAYSITASGTYYWDAALLGNVGADVWPTALYKAETNVEDGGDITITSKEDTVAQAVVDPESAMQEVSSLTKPASSPDPEGETAVVAPTSSISVSEDEKTVTVTIVPKGDDESTNGLLTVAYDPEIMSLQDVSSIAPYISYKDEDGKITFGYVAPDGLAANAGAATLTFKFDAMKCDDASVSVTVKQTERNDKTADVTEHLAAGIHKESEIRNAKEPTCTEKGYTGDICCKACGKVLEAGKEIDALGHDYKNGKCTRCGEKQSNVKTGDESNLNIWFVVLTMSAAITVFAAAVLLRKKRNH